MASRSPRRYSSTRPLAALRRVGQEEEPVPEGFRTRLEWAVTWGLSSQHATKLIRGGVEARLMVMKMIRRKIGDGRTRPIPHYAELQSGL